ncbi:MAG TPA: (S)-ureidoglycine aminohydrolase [Acidobacteriaceae bacterium]|nr:(S)-ureidoglycine aminohydrolase [Acidobacteriaceae bacterium]
MHRLGQTRSIYRPTHLLQTPDTFVRAALPGMSGAAAIVHAAPAMGASFTEYTAEFEPGGVLGPASGQRFIYVLEGALDVCRAGKTQHLQPGGFAHLPQNASHSVSASEKSRAAVIEKRYTPLAGVEPGPALFGSESNIPGQPLMGDEDLRVYPLIPDDAGYDYAVNVMIFQPGAALARVEIHVMEHGLLMLQGGGVYRLAETWSPVTAGDFIWMGAYCPQWFGALGKTPAKYLIYKDWNRHPLAAAH